jgi:hypothetical protein
MSDRDNNRQWPNDARGVYEVWYVTWNHPETDQGFWLRYMTKAPTDGPPRAELWFARFDPRQPSRTFGIHKRFDASELTSGADPFALAIAGSRLAHDHAIGKVSGNGHDVTWDLRWEPSAQALRPFPDVLYARGGLATTMFQIPNPRVPLSGSLTIDGERLTFDRVVAGQSHVWGRKHAYSWTWARCGEFLGAPGAFLEIIGARLQRRGVTLPTLTVVSLDLEGEQYRFNQLRHLPRNRSTWEGGKVTFSAWSPMVKVEGELTCAPSDMVAAPYVDPDGTDLFCMNTEIGDARVTVYRRAGLGWREHRTLEGKRRAHFELGGRVRDPAVTAEHTLVP